MEIGAEISMYPLREQHDEVIIEFIRGLKQKEGLRIHTNDMSTQIAGEANTVFSVIQELSIWVMERSANTVIVVKYLNKAIEPGKTFEIE
jgi:uncharacterized protein YqgV (UPF0045/DUF77 family)